MQPDITKRHLCKPSSTYGINWSALLPGFYGIFSKPVVSIFIEYFRVRKRERNRFIWRFISLNILFSAWSILMAYIAVIFFGVHIRRLYTMQDFFISDQCKHDILATVWFWEVNFKNCDSVHPFSLFGTMSSESWARSPAVDWTFFLASCNEGEFS